MATAPSTTSATLPEIPGLSQGALPNSCLAAGKHWGLGPMAEWLHHAIVADRLAHGWVFQSPHVPSAYRLAMVLAKVLNCEAPPTAGHACGTCRSCRWVDDNAHPALLTLTRWTYLDGEKRTKALGGKQPSKKNIGLEQLTEVLRRVALKNDQVRVTLITDSELALASDGAEGNDAVPPPAELLETLEKKSRQFVPMGLTPAVFDDHGANKILKTLEEPPPNCLFVFLVNDEDRLLETIVSRCQRLHLTSNQLASVAPPVADATALNQILDVLWRGVDPTTNADDVYVQLNEAMDGSPDWKQALAYWQFRWGQALHHMLKQAALPENNALTPAQLNAAQTRLSWVSTARTQVLDYVHVDAVLRQLLFMLCHEQPVA